MRIVEYDRLTWNERDAMVFGEDRGREALQADCDERHQTITNRYHYRVEDENYVLNSSRQAW